MKNSLSILIISLFFFSCANERTNIPINPPDEFQSLRNEIMELVRSGNTPSFGVAVIRNDTVLWKEVITQDTSSAGISISNDGNFELASITKSVTATMIMKLVQDGKIALNSSVDIYLPFELETIAGRNITIKDLMQMQGGIPHGGISLEPGNDHISKDFYKEITEIYNMSIFPEGIHEYSNFSYGILGHVIENVTERSYGSVLKTSLCQPLGMDNTFVLPSTDQRTDIQSTASESHSIFFPTAAAGVISSLGDMIRYAKFQLGSSKVQLLGPENLHKMHFDKSSDDSIFALGWGSISLNDSTSWLLTNGSFPESSNTHITLLPESRIAIICLVNKDFNSMADQMAIRIADLLSPGFADNAMTEMSHYENSNNRTLATKFEADSEWKGTISDSMNEYGLSFKYDKEQLYYQFEYGSWLPVNNPKIDSQGVLRGYIENISLIEPINGTEKVTSGSINLYIDENRNLQGYYLASFNGESITFLDIPFIVIASQ